MEDVRGEILEALQEDYREHRGRSLLAQYLLETKGEKPTPASWLYDRGYGLRGKNEKESVGKGMGGKHAVVREVDLELALAVLARHKEIRIDDYEFDIDQAWQLYELSAEWGLCLLVPIHVDGYTGVGLWLVITETDRRFFVNGPKDRVDLGSPSSKDVLRRYPVWQKRFALYEKSDYWPENCPRRYRDFAGSDPREMVNYSDAKADFEIQVTNGRRQKQLRMHAR